VGKKIKRIKKIFKKEDLIFFETTELDCELCKIGIFLIVKSESKNTNYVLFNQINSIYNVLLKEDKEFLVNKVYLLK
jgi:hypothetical protein